MAEKRLIVSVKPEALADFSEVVRACERVGLQVDEAMDAIGVLAGTIDSECLAALEKVEGIAKVEESKESVIAPPDSDLQ